MSTVEGWENKKLIDLAYFINGYAFKPDDWSKEGLPIIRIEQLKNAASISDYYAGKLPERNIINNDDLIFSWSASLFLKIWKHGKAALNQHLFKVTEKDGFNRLFIKYLIEFYLPEFAKSAHGSTMQHITRKELERFSVLVPLSIQEQTKMAEILSCIDTAIEQTEAMIAKQQRIKTGLMQDLLSKGIDEHGNIRTQQTHAFKDSELGWIPVEWELKQLGDIFQLKSGITPLRANAKYFDFNGHNWVKTLDLNESYLFTTEEKISDFALKNTSIALMPKNSLLVAMYGGWEQIGRTAILKNEAATNQAITCLYNPKIEVEPEFAQIALQYFRYTWKKFAVSTRKDPNITKTDIEKFLIPLPPNVAEQKEISKMIFNVKQDIDISNNQLNKLRQTKTALMQDLLSGNVRVNQLIEN